MYVGIFMLIIRFGCLREKRSMKRPDTGKTFLDFDDVNTILPPNLKLEGERFSRGVYRATDGSLISISNSRVYDKGYLSWYYVYADRYADLGVKYMLFTIGLLGILVVPMDVFQPYKIGCYWKEGLRRGEKRYRIDVTKRDGIMCFINSSQRHQKYLDVSMYFIPFNKNSKD